MAMSYFVLALQMSTISINKTKTYLLHRKIHHFCDSVCIIFLNTKKLLTKHFKDLFLKTILLQFCPFLLILIALMCESAAYFFFSWRLVRGKSVWRINFYPLLNVLVILHPHPYFLVT